MADGQRIDGLTLDITIDPSRAVSGAAVARNAINQTEQAATSAAKGLNTYESAIASVSNTMAGWIARAVPGMGAVGGAAASATAALGPFAAAAVVATAGIAGFVFAVKQSFDQLQQLDKETLGIQRSLGFVGIELKNARGYWEAYRQELQLATGFTSEKMIPVFEQMARATGNLGTARYATNLAAELGQLTGNLNQASQIIAAIYAGQTEIQEEGLRTLGIQRKITEDYVKTHAELVHQSGLVVGDNKTNLMLVTEIADKVNLMKQANLSDEWERATRTLAVGWQEVVAAMRPMAESMKTMIVQLAPLLAQALLRVADQIDRAVTGIRIVMAGTQWMTGGAADIATLIEEYRSRESRRWDVANQMDSGSLSVGAPPAPREPGRKSPAGGSGTNLSELAARYLRQLKMVGTSGLLDWDNPVNEFMGGPGGAPDKNFLDLSVRVQDLTEQFHLGKITVDDYQSSILGVYDALTKSAKAGDLNAKSTLGLVNTELIAIQRTQMLTVMTEQTAQAFGQMGAAAINAALSGGSWVDAIHEVAKSMALHNAAMALQNVAYAIMATTGIGSEILGGTAPQFWQAAADFGIAAGAWGAIAGATSGHGASGASGGAGGGGGKGSDLSTPQSTLDRVQAPIPVVNVYVEGHVLSATELARLISDEMKHQNGRAGA